MIKSGILKQVRGNYGESLIVTGKFGSGRGKQRYCTPPKYNELMFLKANKNQDMDNIKSNQRYLLSIS